MLKIQMRRVYVITVLICHLLGDLTLLHGFVKQSGREIQQNSTRQGSFHPLLSYTLFFAPIFSTKSVLN